MTMTVESQGNLAVVVLTGRLDSTNAADTDWIDCQQTLHAVGLEMENLLPDWLQTRWRQKHPPVRRAK